MRWVGGMARPPFAATANAPALHAAFDLLVGPGRWMRRDSLGAFPPRFSHPDEPDDAGRHIDGSYLARGRDLVFRERTLP